MPRQRVAVALVAGCLAVACSEESKPPPGSGPAGPGSTGPGMNTGGDGGAGGTGGAGASGGGTGLDDATAFNASFDELVGSNLMETGFASDWMDHTVIQPGGGTRVRAVIASDGCDLELIAAIGGALAAGNSYTLDSDSDPETDNVPPDGEAYLSYRKTCPASDHGWRSTGGTLTIDAASSASLSFTFEAPMGVNPFVPVNDATGTFTATGFGNNILLR